MATPRQIWAKGPTGTVTVNNSTDAVKPGHIVTSTGETADTKNVAWPDAADDNSYCVIECAPGHDVNTAYSVGEMMPGYLVGSRTTVWLRIKTSAGAIKRGDLIGNDGATAANGLGIIGTEGTYELIGRAAMDSPDVAAERWCLVVLL